MPDFGNIAGAIAGGMRGYEAAQGRNIPGPSQNGLLMKYRNRRQQQAQQQADAQSQGGIPQGSIPPPMPISTDVGPAPQVGAYPSQPAAPPPNQYSDPFQRRGQPMAQGRIVDKPTTALLGEDGPEAVIPLNGRPDAKVSVANLPQMNYRRGC
jgi:hypothetical protein